MNSDIDFKKVLGHYETNFNDRDKMVEDFLERIQDAVDLCSGSSMKVCNITVSEEFFMFLGKYLDESNMFGGRAHREPHDQVQIYGVVIESSIYYRHSPEMPRLNIICEKCAQEPLWSDDGPYCPVCD